MTISEGKHIAIAAILVVFLTFGFIDAAELSTKRQQKSPVDLLIAHGIEALNRADYTEALHIFQHAIKKEPLNPEVLYYLGIVYSRTKQYPKAEKLLLKALQLIGENDYIYLELGRLYTLTGQCTKARDNLHKVLNSEDKTIREAATELLKICEPPAYGLSAYASVQYDTNVVLEPTNPPIEAPDKEDLKGVFYIDAYLRFFSIGRAKILAKYNLYQSLHRRHELTRFNIHYQRLNPCIQWSPRGGLSTEAGYVLEYSYFGSNLYGRSHGFYLNIGLTPSRDIATIVGYEYQKQRYWDSFLFKDNSVRSGHKNTVTGDITLRARDLQVVLSGAYEWTRTRKIYWDYNSYSLGLMLRHPFQRVLIGMEYEFTENRFRDTFVFTDIKRRDRLHEVSLQLIYNITRGFSLILQQDYSRNTSNIDIFDYERSITSLTLKVDIL